MNTDDLRALLLDRADLIHTNSEPRADEVLARVSVQRRRRTAGAVMGTACLVLAMVAGGALIARNSDDPSPLGLTNSKSPDGTAGPPRKLAWTDEYWTTTSLHYGDRVVDIRTQMANLEDRKGQAGRTWVTLDTTDSGVAFASSLDGRIWFTDGEDTRQIGSHCRVNNWYAGCVESGSSGDLLAWLETSKNDDVELVVYDSSRGLEVARSAVPACEVIGSNCQVGPVVGNDHVYWSVGKEGEALVDPSYEGQFTRLNVATEVQVEVTRQELAADLASRPRGLIVGDSVETGDVTNGLNEQRFEVRGDRLVPTIPDDPGATASMYTPTKAFDTGTRAELKLRIPEGYIGSSEFTVIEWIDDDRIAMMAYATRHVDGHEGYGDTLVCRISSGECTLVIDGPKKPVVPRIVSHIAYPG